MGIFCTLLPNYLVIYAIRRMDPATVSIVITSSLIVSTLCGVLVFGDEFTWGDVVGIILVMTAIIMLDTPESYNFSIYRPFVLEYDVRFR